MLWAHVGVNYPFKCPDSSSRKFLRRVCAQPGVCRAGWRQCSGALWPALSEVRSFHRSPPTPSPGGKMNEPRRRCSVHVVCVGAKRKNKLRERESSGEGKEREKLSSRTDSSSDGEWIKSKCRLQKQTSPAASVPAPFPRIIIRGDIAYAVFS